MINYEEQLEFFKLIGMELKTRVTCFVIGGSAMMFYGAKAETKDVDLVFLDTKDLEKLKEVLFKLGFESRKKLIKIFKRYELINKKNEPVVMEGRNTRFDLFLKQIITFQISDGVVERAKEEHEFDNFVVRVVSPEDIILLKSATEREKDRYDALNIISKYKIDWDVIIKESVNQTKKGSLFPVFLFDFLYELKEDFKTDIPREVIIKIRNISEEMMLKRYKNK
ncbi:nucleotidyltransferase [Candidatus Pacearchaeota archaeon]|nr:nucleotidyltransferase [Candidatus Pacearchaeota archaeon]